MYEDRMPRDHLRGPRQQRFNMELSDEQLQKVKTYQEITNTTEFEIAVTMLTSLDWNVESAIANHLMDQTEGNFPDEDVPMNEVPSSSSAARAVAGGRSENNGRSTPPTAAVVDMEEDDEARIPERERQPYRSSVAIVDGWGSDDDYEEATEIPVARTNGRSNGRNNDLPLIPADCDNPMEATQNFSSVFEARYSDKRAHLMPPFFTGSLSAAMREAFECPERPVSERRPLAIYVHNEASVARNIFVTTVLCTDPIIDLLRGQFVLWPWDVTDSGNLHKLLNYLGEHGLDDARRTVVKYTRECDKFPLLMMLSKEQGQVHLVDFARGMDPANEVMGKLMTTLTVFSGHRMEAEKAERERVEREAIRQEQHVEYEKSLAADRERVAAKEREEREAREKEEAEKKEREDEAARRASLAASLPPEPADGPGAVAVKFRLPETGQLMRRFERSTHLSVLLKYLESEGFPVKDYRMMNSDFPKKDVSQMAPDATLGDLKFPAREQIHVEER